MTAYQRNYQRLNKEEMMTLNRLVREVNTCIESHDLSEFTELPVRLGELVPAHILQRLIKQFVKMSKWASVRVAKGNNEHILCLMRQQFEHNR